jgi:transcriptional regulator with XRE-family HTH domain
MLHDMPTKPQHDRNYQRVTALLRTMREEAELTQRQLAARVKRPHSWVYKSETGIRRLDIAEFVLWCQGCQVEPAGAFKRLLSELR